MKKKETLFYCFLLNLKKLERTTLSLFSKQFVVSNDKLTVKVIVRPPIKETNKSKAIKITHNNIFINIKDYQQQQLHS